MLYLEMFRFTFLRFLVYPYEILASFIRVILEIGFLIFFWSLVSKSSAHPVPVVTYASYFLIAFGVNELVMAQWGDFAGEMERVIKNGSISNYLLKPINILRTFYVIGLGKDGVNKVISLLNIIIGLLLVPPVSLTAFFLFILFLIGAALISSAYNIIEATMFLHSAEAGGIRAAMNHILGILSGLLIPLYFFPSTVQDILRFLPFQWMIYGPIQALKMRTVTKDVLVELSIVVCWSVILHCIAQLFWRYSMKKYEAIGI